MEVESVYEYARALHASENLKFDIKEYVRTSKYVFKQTGSDLHYVS